MNCAAARQAMLEADLAELVAGTGSELAVHVAGCQGCRAAAARILEAERGLAAWLDSRQPRGDTPTAVARAAAAARRRAAVRRLAGIASLLAAAAVGALLLLPRGAMIPAARTSAALTAPQFSVTAPPGRSVVVMHTPDPKIIVVWYLPSRRGS